MTGTENVEWQEFVKQCRHLGLGDVSLHHRKLSEEPLSKDDWGEVYHATLAYQFHLSIIVARARAREHKDRQPPPRGRA